MKRFFIIGCQRTGTTLLRLVLDSHPRVICYDEQLAYSALTHGHEPPQPHCLMGYKIPRWTEQLLYRMAFDPGDDIRPIVWSRRFYAMEPVIFIHRNLSDTVASMLSLRYDSVYWWEQWGKVSLRLMASTPSFREWYKHELDIIGDIEEDRSGAAALYWRFKTESFFEYLRASVPVLPVLYDRLVVSPASELRRIVDFLDLAWSDRLLRHWRISHDEVGIDGKTVGKTDANRPIDRASVGKWRHVLSEDDVNHINEISGELDKSIVLGDFEGRCKERFPVARYERERLLNIKEAVISYGHQRGGDPKSEDPETGLSESPRSAALR